MSAKSCLGLKLKGRRFFQNNFQFGNTKIFPRKKTFYYERDNSKQKYDNAMKGLVNRGKSSILM